MNCDCSGEWLDEYRAGELPPDTRAEVEDHLASCPACRTELDACRRLAESLPRLPQHQPGAQACLRVSAAIHADTPPPRRTDFGPVLDFADLAEYLRVDPAALEPYVGDIPCFEIGGRLLFRKAKVEEWIASRELTADFGANRAAIATWNVPVTNTGKGEVSWMLSQRN